MKPTEKQRLMSLACDAARATGLSVRNATQLRSLLIAGVATGVILSSPAAYSLLKVEEPNPRRQDIVASYSDGTGTAIADVKYSGSTETTSTNLTAGKVVLSTNDASCRPGPGKACPYTVVDIRFRLNDFTSHGANLKSFDVRLVEPAVGLLDHGGGLSLQGKTRFVVSGFVNDTGNPLGMEITPAGSDALDLHVNLDAQSVTMVGTLAGKAPAKAGQSEEDRDALTMHLNATSLSPFANMPPVAVAGSDRSVSTSCYASVKLTPASTDSNGNLLSETWVEGGVSLGSGIQTVRMLPGRHQVDLIARDSFYGQDADRTVVTVIDDGKTDVPTGATLIEFQYPKSVSLGTVGLLAKEALKVSDRVSIQPAPGEVENIVNFGPAGTSIMTNLHADSKTYANVWSRPKTWLLERAWIGGGLFAATQPDQQNNTTAVGGFHIPADFSFATFSFVVPPSAGKTFVTGLEPQTTKSLNAGEYTALNVKSGATLTLTGGVYRFARLDTEPGGNLVLSSSTPTLVYVEQGSTLRGTLSKASGGGLVLVNLGTTEVLAGSPFSGTIFAPYSQLTLNNSGSGSHVGTFFAKNIQIDSASTVVHASFDFSLFTASRSACALTPVLQCVKPSSSGYIARFSYQNDVQFSGVRVPRGFSNRILPGAVNQGQPEHFRAGYLSSTTADLFEVPFAANSTVTWVLGGKQVTATAASTRCQ